MTPRIATALLAGLLFTALLVPGFARAKQHRQSQAAHLARVAAHEKAAWHKHLAKVRELPRAERVSLKHHDRRLKRDLHAQHVAVALAKQAQAARHHRLAKAHKTHHAVKAPVVAKKPMAHPKRLVAAQQTAHQKNLAGLNATHQAHLANLKMAHDKRLAAHNERLAKAQAVHNAHVALARAHQTAQGGSNRSIRYWTQMVAGVPVKVIMVDLNDDNVKVSAVLSRRGNGTSEPFGQMISRTGPNVAVTGTFFSLDNLRPVGDIVIDGSLVHFGGMGTALCITPKNRARMVACTWGRHHDWSSYDFVCACGPRLLQGGRITLDPAAERFRDRHMLAPNSRIAVGITDNNKLLFTMTRKPIYLGRLAKVMHALGAEDAMNLDAGTSTGFYYNGSVLAHPGRALTNVIVVYSHKDRYQRALRQLVPAIYHRAAPRYAHRRYAAR